MFLPSPPPGTGETICSPWPSPPHLDTRERRRIRARATLVRGFVPRLTVERNGGGGGRRRGTYLTNQREIHASTSAAQVRSNGCGRPRGWTVFHLTSPRSVLETPSTSWLRAHRPHASVLDDEQRRPASRLPPGGPAAAAGQPPSFARRLRVRVPRRPPPAPCSILLSPHGRVPRHAGPSSPWRLPTAAFSWTPAAPTQSRRPSSCLLECWLDQPPAPLQSPARDATVYDPRRACDARRRRTSASRFN